MNRRLTPARTVAVCGVVLLAGLLGTVAVLESDARRLDVPTQIVQVKSDPSGSPQTLRPLAPRQRRQARRILARDGRFKGIVDPHSYQLKGVVPWGIEDRRRRRHREVFIGTSMQAVLNTPKPSVVAEWPLVDYPDDKRPAYRIRTFQLTVRGLRSMSVNVDLKRRKVAGISPRAADEIIYPPDYKPPPPSGE